MIKELNDKKESNFKNDKINITIDKIQKFRTQPEQLYNDLIDLSKFWKSYKIFSNKGVEVEKFAEKMNERKGKKIFQISDSLNEAAKDICLNHDEKILVDPYKLKGILLKYLKSFKGVEHIIDYCEIEKFPVRCLFSDLDPNRKVQKIFLEEKVKFIGFYSYELDGIQKNTLIFVEEIEEYSDINEKLLLIAKSELIRRGSLILCSGEKKILHEINKFRFDQTCFKKLFSSISFILSNEKKEILDNIINNADKHEKLNKYIISYGLSQAADDILKGISNLEKDFIKTKDLNSKVKPFVKNFKEVFEIQDKGETNLIIPRILISDYDPMGTYRNSILSNKFKYIGFATRHINEEDEEINIILLAEEIEENDELKLISEEENIIDHNDSDSSEIVEIIKSNEVPEHYEELIEETINKLRLTSKSFSDICIRYGKQTNSPLLIKEGKILSNKNNIKTTKWNNNLSLLLQEAYNTKTTDIKKLFEKYFKSISGVTEYKENCVLNKLVFKIILTTNLKEIVFSEKYNYVGFFTPAYNSLLIDDEKEVPVHFIFCENLQEYTEEELQEAMLLKEFPIKQITEKAIIEEIKNFRSNPNSFEKNFSALSNYYLKQKKEKNAILVEMNINNLTLPIEDGKKVVLTSTNSQGLNSLSKHLLNNSNKVYDEQNFFKKAKGMIVLEDKGRLEFLISNLFNKDKVLLSNEVKFFGFATEEVDKVKGLFKSILILAQNVTEKGEKIIEERDPPVKKLTTEAIFNLINLFRTDPSNEAIIKGIMEKINSDEKRKDRVKDAEELKKKLEVFKSSSQSKLKLMQSKGLEDLAVRIVKKTHKEIKEIQVLIEEKVSQVEIKKDEKRIEKDKEIYEEYRDLKNDFVNSKGEILILDQGRIDYILPRLLIEYEKLLLDDKYRYVAVATREVKKFKNKKTMEGDEFESKDDPEEPFNLTLVIISEDIVELKNKEIRPVMSQPELIMQIVNFNKNPRSFSNYIKHFKNYIRSQDTINSMVEWTSQLSLISDKLIYAKEKVNSIEYSLSLSLACQEILEKNIDNICSYEYEFKETEKIRSILAKNIKEFKSFKLVLDTGRYDFMLGRLLTNKKLGNTFDENELFLNNYKFFGIATTPQFNFKNKDSNKRNILIFVEELKQKDNFEIVPFKNVDFSQQINLFRQEGIKADILNDYKNFLLLEKNFEKVQLVDAELEDLKSNIHSPLSSLQISEGLNLIAINNPVSSTDQYIKKITGMKIIEDKGRADQILSRLYFKNKDDLKNNNYKYYGFYSIPESLHVSKNILILAEEVVELNSKDLDKHKGKVMRVSKRLTNKVNAIVSSIEKRLTSNEIYELFIKFYTNPSLLENDLHELRNEMLVKGVKANDLDFIEEMYFDNVRLNENTISSNNSLQLLAENILDSEILQYSDITDLQEVKTITNLFVDHKSLKILQIEGKNDHIIPLSLICDLNSNIPKTDKLNLFIKNHKSLLLGIAVDKNKTVLAFAEEIKEKPYSELNFINDVNNLRNNPLKLEKSLQRKCNFFLRMNMMEEYNKMMTIKDEICKNQEMKATANLYSTQNLDKILKQIKYNDHLNKTSELVFIEKTNLSESAINIKLSKKLKIVEGLFMLITSSKFSLIDLLHQDPTLLKLFKNDKLCLAGFYKIDNEVIFIFAESIKIKDDDTEIMLKMKKSGILFHVDIDKKEVSTKKEILKQDSFVNSGDFDVETVLESSNTLTNSKTIHVQKHETPNTKDPIHSVEKGHQHVSAQKELNVEVKKPNITKPVVISKPIIPISNENKKKINLRSSIIGKNNDEELKINELVYHINNYRKGECSNELITLIPSKNLNRDKLESLDISLGLNLIAEEIANGEKSIEILTKKHLKSSASITHIESKTKEEFFSGDDLLKIKNDKLNFIGAAIHKEKIVILATIKLEELFENDIYIKGIFEELNSFRLKPIMINTLNHNSDVIVFDKQVNLSISTPLTISHNLCEYARQLNLGNYIEGITDIYSNKVFDYNSFFDNFIQRVIFIKSITSINYNNNNNNEVELLQGKFVGISSILSDDQNRKSLIIITDEDLEFEVDQNNFKDVKNYLNLKNQSKTQINCKKLDEKGIFELINIYRNNQILFNHLYLELSIKSKEPKLKDFITNKSEELNSLMISNELNALAVDYIEDKNDKIPHKTDFFKEEQKILIIHEENIQMPMINLIPRLQIKSNLLLDKNLKYIGIAEKKDSIALLFSYDLKLNIEFETENIFEYVEGVVNGNFDKEKLTRQAKRSALQNNKKAETEALEAIKSLDSLKSSSTSGKKLQYNKSLNKIAKEISENPLNDQKVIFSKYIKNFKDLSIKLFEDVNKLNIEQKLSYISKEKVGIYHKENKIVLVQADDFDELYDENDLEIIENFNLVDEINSYRNKKEFRKKYANYPLGNKELETNLKIEVENNLEEKEKLIPSKLLNKILMAYSKNSDLKKHLQDKCSSYKNVVLLQFDSVIYKSLAYILTNRSNKVKFYNGENLKEINEKVSEVENQSNIIVSKKNSKDDEEEQYISFNQSILSDKFKYIDVISQINPINNNYLSSKYNSKVFVILAENIKEKSIEKLIKCEDWATKKPYALSNYKSKKFKKIIFPTTDCNICEHPESLKPKVSIHNDYSVLYKLGFLLSLGYFTYWKNK